MIENGHANAAMVKDYMSLLNRCNTTEEENKKLKATLDKSIHDNQLKTSDIFDRSTEKLSGLVDSPIAVEIVDEDTAEAAVADVIPLDGTSRKSQHHTGIRKHGGKTSGKRQKDLVGIPTVNVYELDIEELNRQYGEGNWRIAYWHAWQGIRLKKLYVGTYHK